jgi:hypothetical protein
MGSKVMAGCDGQDGRVAHQPDEETTEVRFVHPFQARKSYVCPGCQQSVPAGTGHVVAVPRGDPASRRHWHRPCWEQRERRRPGRR